MHTPRPSRARTLLPCALLLGPALLTGLLAPGAVARPAQDPGDAPPTPSAPERGEDEAELTDGELEPYRRDLLERAFEAVSGLPLNPHIKNMARFQERVVEAALELEQGTLVLGWVDRIPNWRRGSAYADLAFLAAERGETAHVQEWLERAAAIATEETDAQVQRWRRDAVRVRIARVQALLGDLDMARKLEHDVGDPEVGKVDAVLALRGAPERFDAEFERLKGVLAGGNFDQMQVALDTCVELHDRFHDDAERREALEVALREGFAKMPIKLRLGLLFGLTENALGHDAPDLALRHVAEAQGLVDVNEFLPQDEVALRGRLGGLRWRAGDREKGAREVSIAAELFEHHHDAIVNIERADALRPVAEALHAMGRAEDAARTYALVIENGQANPNSRPRCEDLSLTLISMARVGFRPDDALLERIARITAGFGDPW